MIGSAIRILGGLIKIVGNTTGIPIGNVLDALKVNLRNAAGNEIGTPADPIFVEFPENADRTPINTFGEVLAVASGITTTIVSYTVPVAKEVVLERVSVTGENIAIYKVLINGLPIDAQHTNFGGDLNAQFDFISKASLGPVYVAGDIISVTVLHNRTMSGNFSSRIQVTMLN